MILPVLFCVSFFAHAGEAESVHVKRISGAYIEKIYRPDAMYETLVPVVFVMNLPTIFHDNHTVQCNDTVLLCELEKAMHQMNNNIENVAVEVSRAVTNGRRRKRQIIIGGMIVGGLAMSKFKI
jgi:hypothetical protein